MEIVNRFVRGIQKEGSQQQKFFIIMAALFGLLGIVMITSFGNDTIVSASVKQGKKQVKCVQIQKGDTLWEIAEQNFTDEYVNIQDYIEEIMECNSMTTETIYEGAYLTVPYYTSD